MLTMSGCVSNPIKTSHGRSEVLAILEEPHLPVTQPLVLSALL